MTNTASSPTLRERAEELARRTGAAIFDLEVREAIALSPSATRLRLHSPDLAGFSYEPGQDVMLSMLVAGDDVLRRRYTIRHFDATAQLLDIDFGDHEGGGPAIDWAQRAKVGDRIEAIGPRGKVFLDRDAKWHLFVGDDAFVPAAFAMAEGLSPESKALFVLEVQSDKDEREHDVKADVADLRWVYRGDEPAGSSAALLDALGAVTLPSGAGHAYIGGEHRVVTALRDLLVEKGMAASDISPKSYWRKGVANASHGEPPRE